MKNTIRRRLGGTALTLAMLLGICFAASSTAQAQYRDYDRYGNGDQVRWPQSRTRDFAFALGYHNAWTEGNEAAKRGYRPNHRDMPGYRNSDNGWKSWMGHDDTYRDSYRKGYEEGFKDGQSNRQRRIRRQDVERILGDNLRNVYGDNRYDGFDDRYDYDGRNNDRYDDRYDNRDGNRNNIMRIAQENGYRDGQRHGREDVNRRRGFDYDDSSEYRSADRGYRSQYGNRSAYQQVYRDAYRQGYEDGYRNRSNNRGGFQWPF